jgi:hypothetical protein
VQCQRIIDVDDAARAQCPNEATRRAVVSWQDPPRPGQHGEAGTIYYVVTCDQHDPDPGHSVPIRPPTLPPD